MGKKSVSLSESFTYAWFEISTKKKGCPLQFKIITADNIYSRASLLLRYKDWNLEFSQKVVKPCLNCIHLPDCKYVSYKKFGTKMVAVNKMWWNVTKYKYSRSHSINITSLVKTSDLTKLSKCFPQATVYLVSQRCKLTFIYSCW